MQLNIRTAIWNANGLSNHIREVEIFLNTNYIDLLLVSETHFTSRTYFHIRGYDLIHTNHPDNRAHAGSCILIKSSIRYDILSEVKENFLQATNIKVKCNNYDIVVSSIYFPPRYTVTCSDYHQFFNSLGQRFIVGGDFNAKHPWWGSRISNPKGKELYKCLQNNNYSVLSTGSPTHWPSDPHKLPDLLDFAVYSGISSNRLEIKSLIDLSSDHTPVLINFNTSVNLKTLNSSIIKPYTNIPTFQCWLDQHINLNVRLKTGRELDNAVEHFTNLIHEAVNLATPNKPRIQTRSMQISTEVRQLIREKRRLRRNWMLSRNTSDKRLFNKACKDLKKMLYEQKNKATAEFIERINNSKYDEHLLWKSTKYLKRPTKRNTIIQNTDGSWYKSDKSISEAFALHLFNTFQPHQLNSIEENDEVTTFFRFTMSNGSTYKTFYSK